MSLKKKILILENKEFPTQLGSKIEHTIPFLSEMYNIDYEKIENHTKSNYESILVNPIQTVKKIRYILRSVQFNCVLVRNIIDVNLLRFIRLFVDPLILEISPQEPGDLFQKQSFQSSQLTDLKSPIGKATKTGKYILLEGNYLIKALRRLNMNVLKCPPLIRGRDLNIKKKQEVVNIGSAGIGENSGAVKSLEEPLIKISYLNKEINTIVRTDNFVKLKPPVKLIYNNIMTSNEQGLFSDIDIFFVPPRVKGISIDRQNIFALSAMASKIPCIVWENEIDESVFEDGKDLFIARNGEEFFNKLSLLINDGNLREKISSGGYEKATSQYAPEISAKFYLNLFDNILGEKID